VVKFCGVLLLSFTLAGCGEYWPGDESIPWELSCRHLAELKTRDAVADARTALVSGDARLLMLGGYVLDTPYDPVFEINDAQWQNQVLIPETEEVDGCPSDEARSMAMKYARLYNDTILAKIAVRHSVPQPVPLDRIGRH
jgi:hypothetical protein